jgi:hypothetical protein
VTKMWSKDSSRRASVDSWVSSRRSEFAISSHRLSARESTAS